MIDEGEWRKLIRSSKRELLFIILGISGIWVGISARGRPEVEPLIPLID